jgi:hypothetical protein
MSDTFCAQARCLRALEPSSWCRPASQNEKTVVAPDTLCAQARYLRALLPLSAIILGRSHGQQLVACDDARSMIKMIHCKNLMIQITTNKVDIFIGPSAGTFCRVTFCRKLLAEGSKAPALAEGGRRSHPNGGQPYHDTHKHDVI